MKVLVPLLILLSSNLYAFTFNNNGELVFENNEVVINVSNNTCANGLNPQDILSYTRTAIDEYWNRVPTSNLKLVLGGIVDDRNNDFKTATDICDSNDSGCGILVTSGILISCNENHDRFNSNTFGIALPNNITNEYIHGSLVLLNGKSVLKWQNLTADESIAIIAHELGHAIGLGHSPVRAALMYYTSIPERRSLGWDDIDGLTYLYPAEQPFGASCGTIDLGEGPKGGPGSFLFALSLGFLLVTLKRRSPAA